MELNEVKIGDLVTYKDQFKREIVGKVIHRHDALQSPHLAGHVNVQKVGGSPSYPVTLHVSKLKPHVPIHKRKPKKIKEQAMNLSEQLVETTTLKEWEVYNKIMHNKEIKGSGWKGGVLMKDVAAHYGIDKTKEHIEALKAERDAKVKKDGTYKAGFFHDQAIKGLKHSIKLMNPPKETPLEPNMAHHPVNEDIDMDEVITQEEFDALSPEEQAEYEIVEDTDVEEVPADEVPAEVTTEEEPEPKVLLSEAVNDLVNKIMAGDNVGALETYDQILQDKAADALVDAKVEVANRMFNEDEEEPEVISQEEFEALTPEEQAEFEEVILDEDDEEIVNDDSEVITQEQYDALPEEMQVEYTLWRPKEHGFDSKGFGKGKKGEAKPPVTKRLTSKKAILKRVIKNSGK